MSSLGIEILSVKEVSFQSHKDNIEKNHSKNETVNILQKFDIISTKEKDNKIGITYIIEASIKPLKGKITPIFRFETFSHFQLDNFDKVKTHYNKVVHIEQDLLRLLISVSVGSSRGLLLSNSNSLPEDFIIPIIDIESVFETE